LLNGEERRGNLSFIHHVIEVCGLRSAWKVATEIATGLTRTGQDELGWPTGQEGRKRRRNRTGQHCLGGTGTGRCGLQNRCSTPEL